MEAIILAGGLGTRLKGILPDLPKPMAPVLGRPFLEILLSKLSKSGFQHVVLSLGYKPEVFIKHFGRNYAGMAISYVIEDKQLGTGGATRLALSACKDNEVFVINGDTFLDFEIDSIYIQYKNKKPIVVAREVSDASRYGSLIVKGGLLKGFSEKGKIGPGIINAGCYLFNRNQLDDYDINQNFSLESDYLEKVVPNLEIVVFLSKGKFIDIGVPEDYFRAQDELINFV
jgi:D-glycero-alpha-D-manno-heptose 1-phosphate guanylyltransferase